MTHISLRKLLAARYGHTDAAMLPLDIPARGEIGPELLNGVQLLAKRAKSGETAARDALYFSLQPRIDCIGWALRPWPNSSTMVGIWGRDDVLQESWVVFSELLSSWDGTMPFIPYFLARFAWRLRDRIFRGIGKSQTQLGTTRIGEEQLTENVLASDADQPESAAIARSVLEDLIKHYKQNADIPEADALLALVHARKVPTLARVIHLPVDEISLSQIDAA